MWVPAASFRSGGRSGAAAALWAPTKGAFSGTSERAQCARFCKWCTVEETLPRSVRRQFGVFSVSNSVQELTAETWRRVRFDAAGLVPAIVQDAETNQVLMLAYMNRDALSETLQSGRAVYYSRSRKALWRKGDTSGQVQWVRELYFDCDMDALLLRVKQVGVACHTGRYSCFWQRVAADGQTEEALPVLVEPQTLYGRQAAPGSPAA
ncbi:histidine biosynthesis bifunctional protein HisIE [Cyanidioschyzon merolae strain 10D]|jgi:phosphoribosyl-AMP cyclohydrolase|uniref:Histidine biosynthesis bifunctional protein HisIE n=1 Tax=Cyanidioschyzon merolae (strain NIES-3377 / 10D) TaxID=280699 RepID=M1VAQ9_CYAM1|nr:histidine biosynthesis bifunctional protein HisIE [Cyanidioschyzon merolae strain 10D]BAM82234.1 histidine biosynthesis bifunctional protein HisIE [Cyanidioschyzon merolae strain 10D]|eukprot:XP_005538270.1 histidine biosynthesis bifunctional protein HisIE [Cyanidioschyzon merolae strain 10D]